VFVICYLTYRYDTTLTDPCTALCDRWLKVGDLKCSIWQHSCWYIFFWKGHCHLFWGLLVEARQIVIRGNPKILVQFRLKLLYQFSETVTMCVWLPIARMEMDWNLKTSGWCFQFLLFFFGKIARNWLWFALPHWENHSVSFSWCFRAARARGKVFNKRSFVTKLSQIQPLGSDHQFKQNIKITT